MDVSKIRITPEMLEEEWTNSIPLGLSAHHHLLIYVQKVLVGFNGNRTKAAKSLGISKRTLWNRMDELREFGIDIPESRIGKKWIGVCDCESESETIEYISD